MSTVELNKQPDGVIVYNQLITTDEIIERIKVFFRDRIAENLVLYLSLLTFLQTLVA